MKQHDHDAARRKFLETAARLSVLGAAAPIGLNLAAAGAAAAQTASDYRALVCVFLYGANDHNNTIIPLDSDNYNAYRNARPSLARALTDLNDGAGNALELAPSVALAGSNAGRRFALPKELAPLAPLWNSQRLAVLANVGPLLVPTTKSQFQNLSVPLPAQLFSHNDQQSTWQAGLAEGAPSGWGGRIGDLFASQNGDPVFTCTSVTGDAIWLTGNATKGYQVGPDGSVRIGALTGSLFGSSTASATLRTLIGEGGSHPFTQDLVATVQRSIAADASLTAALSSAPALALPADQSDNTLAAQLRMVARMIAARGGVSARRQLFFVGLGGFDTHDNQLADQAPLHAKVAGALSYFDAALTQLGVSEQVTTFTASDFGRTLTSNGDGSDHGWGSHHFVMGGAVRGKRFYGSFPVMGVGNDDEVGSGRLLPSTSVDQYAATLARWFGVTSDAELRTVLPNLGNFSGADLGFMG